MSAELAARRTAAAAVLADFRRADAAFYGHSPRTAPKPNYSEWAGRLATELASLLRRLDTEDGSQGAAAGQLAEVREMFARFDSGRDDLQYFIERVEQIVNGRPR